MNSKSPLSLNCVAPCYFCFALCIYVVERGFVSLLTALLYHLKFCCALTLKHFLCPVLRDLVGYSTI